MSDILKPLERLYENARYTGDDAENWTAEVDKEQIESFIKEHDALLKSHAELVSHIHCLRGFVMMRHKRWELIEAGFIDEWDKIGKFLTELPEEQALTNAEKREDV